MLNISIYLSASHSHLANILNIFFLMLGIMLGPRDTQDKQYWIPPLKDPLSLVCPKVSYIYSGAEKLEE